MSHEIIPTNNIQSNIRLTSNKVFHDQCILYIFSPRKLPDHTIRPLTYKFNHAFIEDMTEEMTESYTLNHVLKSPKIATTIVPETYNPIIAKTSDLSQYWTFVLIFDGSTVPNNLLKNDLEITVAQPRNFRILYTGYFDDEPVNMTTIHANASNPTFNPNTRLIITRRSIFKKPTNINAMNFNPTPRLDNDMVVHNVPNNIYHTPTHLLDKSAIYSITPNKLSLPIVEENQIVSTVSQQNSLSNPNNNKTLTTWENPYSHISNILNTIKNSIDANIVDEPTHTSIMIDDILRNDISESFRANDNADDIDYVYHHIGLEVDVYYQLQDILKYDPDVLIVKNTNNQMLSVVDSANYVTPETIYASILEYSIPAMLYKWNLSHISFQYDSYSNYQEIFSVEGIDQMSSQQLERMTYMFLKNLKEEIYPFLKFNSGDFILSVSSSIYGSTLINLRFYDFMSVGEQDYIEHVNTLGGISSNTLGTADHYTQNVSSLFSLTNHIVDSITEPIDPFSNPNDIV